MRLAIAAAALLLLGESAAIAAPGGITPAPETTPMKPVGAADRVANGPSLLATPPADVGSAPDPDEAPGSAGNEVAPTPK